MAGLPAKPSRTTTKRLVYGNNIAAWGVLVTVAFLAPAAVGDVAWPLAFIIVGILGFYTGTGSFDLHSLAKVAQARGTPPYAPYDGPPPVGEGE
ncbi:hypothetical protein N8E89_09370 [Phyllobacterium sp. A18/5-2]|uniref:hypothetical protein n=1 Tax=Phyllobacterium sp. A18/5-2 TaxID=2978392 RepID=UPI0021C96398|nr:hypothetical protein [Phyllobacterium sp. A18/5-2]UXN62925.1 hypothetical protein N8E89_09370 [Phyllobacterium sp. A18/5-2]